MKTDFLSKFILLIVFSFLLNFPKLAFCQTDQFQSRLAIVTRHSVTIRSSPRYNGKIYFKPKYGDIIQITGKYKKYYAVLMKDGRFGWVLQRDIILLPFEIHRQLMFVKP